MNVHHSTNIHTSAIIEKGAIIGKNCTVGPFCYLGSEVVLSENTTLISHVSITGDTLIGENTKIWPFASIGHDPQDLKFAGEKTKLIIGQNNKIRESVSINPGTTGGGGITLIGDNCLLMAYVHIGHDCILGDNIVLANMATLGGHVSIDNNTSLGGGVLVHQFCKIGEHSLVGGGLRVVQDIPPYIIANGQPLKFSGINSLGLRRRDFNINQRKNIKQAYKIIYNSNLNRTQALEKLIQDFSSINEIKIIIKFIKNSDRGLI